MTNTTQGNSYSTLRKHSKNTSLAHDKDGIFQKWSLITQMSTVLEYSFKVDYH